jgi:hypothetical protein
MSPVSVLHTIADQVFFRICRFTLLAIEDAPFSFRKGALKGPSYLLRGQST